MKLNYLLGAVAASALMTGAAYAQAGASTQPGTDATTDQGVPSATGTTSSTTSSSTMPSTSATGSVSGSTTDTTAGATTDTTTSATGVTATSATTYGQGASVTTTMTTNGPVPDTAENRAKYGGPMSHAGKRSAPKGN